MQKKMQIHLTSLTSYPLFQNNQSIYKPENELQWREKDERFRKENFRTQKY